MALVFDIGMHKGEDTEFYLSRGHEVVGVEANPELLEFLRARFSAEIKCGKVRLIDKAISDHAGRIRFAISENSTWGSASQKFIERNQSLGKTHEFVEVDSVPLSEVIREYGTPYYLKMDIEGMEMTCVKALHGVDAKPRYISMESAVTSSVADTEAAFEELANLWVMGYRHFKYVDQSGLSRLHGSWLDVEGDPVRYQYRADSSGPFGEESPGRWQSIAAALARMRVLVFYQNTIGMGGRYHKTALSRIGRRLYRFLRHSHSWYDLHARLG